VIWSFLHAPVTRPREVTPMSRYTLTHLPDSTLLRDLKTLVSQERGATALLIAHLAEVDAGRLYAPAGYPSLFEWCVAELHLSEDAAYKRIRVARTARQFPAIYDLLADGRLHMTAVMVLTPYLTEQNADGLLAAAAHRSKAGIETLLAERFPRPDLSTSIEAITPLLSASQLAPEPVKFSPTEHSAPVSEPRARVAPLAPHRFAAQFTMDQEAYDDLLYAQALLGHAVPSGDPAQVIARALKHFVANLEKQKFARTDRPRRCQPSENARQIPADVKRAVWERDGGQCTFVGENGHRCEARTRLEFDHVEAVAQGGRSTVQGLRLRCRAHNQFTAEQAFGRDFMNTKRETRGKPPLPEHVAEVVPWVRSLGFKADEARRLAECCKDMPDAPLEQRVRHALKCSARSSPKRVA
jgi:5-methylcytosine-specific restriction endonuclease McrA